MRLVERWPVAFTSLLMVSFLPNNLLRGRRAGWLGEQRVNCGEHGRVRRGACELRVVTELLRGRGRAGPGARKWLGGGRDV